MFHKTGGNMAGAGSAKQDQTLSDYYKRMQYTPKPKLTFDEWWNEEVYTGQKRKHEFLVGENAAKIIWKAAQENM